MAWITRIRRQQKDLGTLEPQTYRCGRRPILTDEQRKQLAEIVRKTPDVTLKQLRVQLGVKCCLQVIWDALNKIGFTYKKSVRAAEQDRPDVKEQRARWLSSQRRLDFIRLIFNDETAAKTNMLRLRGRCPRGERLVVKVTKTDTGAARIDWSRIEAYRDWTTLSAGWKLAERNTVGSKRIKVQGDTEG